MDNILFLLGAGLMAGSMNAVAGGGSFITFPALIYAGVPPVAANASSTVALFPASLTSAWEYRNYIKPFPRVSMSMMLAVTFTGGLLGSIILLYTPPAGFKDIVPWLLLTGSTAFAFGKKIGVWLRQHCSVGAVTLLISQFLLGIYGGYFGGAVGIMMMSVWSMLGFTDIRTTNANKNLFVGVANAIAVSIFIMAGKVAWPETIVLLAASVAGGFIGARYSKKVNPARLRTGIVIFNFIITAAFFVKTYT